MEAEMAGVAAEGGEEEWYEEEKGEYDYASYDKGTTVPLCEATAQGPCARTARTYSPNAIGQANSALENAADVAPEAA
jgi:hypothetical protein